MFLRFGISLKIARQFFDQLAVVSWSYVFSHAWAPVTFLASSSDWFIWLSERFVIRQSIYFVSGLTCVTSQIWPFPFRKEVILHKPAKRREFPSTFDPHVELFYGDCCLYFQLSPQVRESKTVLDSGLLAVDPGFWILCQWNFLSGFQSLVVLRIPWVISRIPEAKFPGFRIPQAKSSRTLDSTSKISRIQDSTSKNFPESGIRIPLHGATTSSRLRTFHNFVVVRRRISFAIYFSIK